MTPATMDPTLRSLLLARLAASDLDEDARGKIRAAAGAEDDATLACPDAQRDLSELTRPTPE